MSETSATLLRVRADTKEAMKAKDATTLKVLRAIANNAGARAKSALRKDAAGTLVTEPTEDEVVAAVRDEIKKSGETLDGFKKLNRVAEVAALEAEIAVFAKYLPQALEGDALVAAIEAVVTELQAASMKDMGKVMGELAVRFGTRLDKAVASPLVKQRLSR